MAKRVSKNQRTNRGANAEQKSMARLIVAAKKPNGQYEYRQKMVDASTVQEELQAARNG